MPLPGGEKGLKTLALRVRLPQEAIRPLDISGR